MAALTGPRDTKARTGQWNRDPMAAATKIYRGAGVCLDSSGNAVAASATTGLLTRGVARDTVDNSSGLAGAKNIDTQEGFYIFDNKSGDELSQDEVLDVCYWSDDHTVCKTGTGKSVAGVVASVHPVSGFVTVWVGPWPFQSGLLSANNLSDVGSASTSRANLGANKFSMAGEKISSKASDAEVFRFVIPRACTISSAYAVLNAALAAADGTVQLAKVGAGSIGSTTTGRITLTQAASAANSVFSCTPLTTNLTFAAGDVITATVGGGSTATATFNLTLDFTY